MAKKETVKKEIVKKDELREEKMKALENALTQLNKTYGKGSVMKFSDKVADTNPVSYTHLATDVGPRGHGLQQGIIHLVGIAVEHAQPFHAGDIRRADHQFRQQAAPVRIHCLLYTSRCV